SRGFGRLSHLMPSGSESSSSMISLQRSMHSSQMYTPGPAMSFFTCFWLFPQNEHFSRSPPSPMRATQFLLYMGPPRGPGRSGVAGMSRHAVNRLLFDGTALWSQLNQSNPLGGPGG